MMNMKKMKLVFDTSVIDEYADYYFTLHPRARKKPIPHPYHESINKWMILKRPAMNALKQKWKDFGVWFIGKKGLTDMNIEKCQMLFYTFYGTNHKHDPDNSVPKFILDSFVESHLIVGDDCEHLEELRLRCSVDIDNPRTEITIWYE